jgi:YfiH family protein
MAANVNVYQPKVFLSDRLAAGFTLRNAHIRTSERIPGFHFNGALPEEKETVHAHYRLLAEQQGFDSGAVTWVTQVHGDAVVYATKTGHLGSADALYTDRPGIILTVRVADCAAILMADINAGVVAAVHAGWRGARLQIAAKTIALMKEKGANPQRMQAYVSPCISAASFEVGEEVAAEFPEQYVIREGFLKPHVDLKSYVFHQLTGSGIPAENIEVDQRCTMKDKDLYSYRREGEVSGRMVAFIGLR